MKPYPKYKDSRVEGICEVPEHWEVLSFRRLIEFLTDYEANGSFADTKKNVTVDVGKPYAWYVRGTDLEHQRFGLVEGNRYCDEYSFNWLSKTALCGGDLLITKRGEIGKVYVVPDIECKATLAPNLYLIRLNQKLLPRYGLYWFSVDPGKSELVLADKSTTIGALYKDDVKSCIVLAPPCIEQTLITAFLDNKTAEIDGLIANKERLIALYEEEKTGAINQAVTKGLDPDAPMKPSGIDWLGDIPEHWETKKLRYLFEIKKRIAGELGLDVLSITQRGIKIKDVESLDGQISSDYSKYQLVEKGDFAMNHMDLLTGYVDISKYDGVTSPDYRVFSLSDQNGVDIYFLFLFQLGYKNRIFYAFGRGAAQFGRWRFPAEEFKAFEFPVPPKDEQTAIVQHIETECSRLDAIIDKFKKQIELLKEYRTTLISEVVTGKIDVRDEMVQ